MIIIEINSNKIGHLLRALLCLINSNRKKNSINFNGLCIINWIKIKFNNNNHNNQMKILIRRRKKMYNNNNNNNNNFNKVILFKLLKLKFLRILKDLMILSIIKLIKISKVLQILFHKKLNFSKVMLSIILAISNKMNLMLGHNNNPIKHNNNLKKNQIKHLQENLIKTKKKKYLINNNSYSSRNINIHNNLEINNLIIINFNLIKAMQILEELMVLRVFQIFSNLKIL